MKRVAVLILLTFCFIAKPAHAGNDASVSGLVLDPSDKPVPNATVQLNQSSGAAQLAASSDRSGAYSFSNVSPGDYLLTATAEGLSVQQPISLHLKTNEAQTINVKLIISAQRSQVTVTAADAPQSIDLVSKALDVVDVAEAESRGIFSVPDALAQVPGLRVTTRGGPGSFTTIQTRGLRATDTAFLIDGFRFRDDTGVQGDASSFISDLFLVDSSRIEVLRGSGSSLYGTNSMAGTVNIITDHGGGPLHGDVDYQGGGLGLNRGLAQVAGGALSNRLTYSGGIAYLNERNGVNNGGAARNWSGQGSATVAITPSIRLGARLFADTDYLQLQVDAYPVGTPTSLIIPAIPPSSAQLALANAGLPFDTTGATFVPALNDPDARRNAHFISSLLHLDQQVTSKLSWRLSYQHTGTHRDNLDGPGGPGPFQPLFNTSDLYNGGIDTAQARVDYIAAPWHLITAGYEFERETYTNLGTDENPDVAQRTYSLTLANQRSNAAFVQDQLQLFRGKLLILLSGRFQSFRLNNPQFYGGNSPYAGVPLPLPASAYTGDASLAYYIHRSSTKLRAHVGNAFREPSLYERFGTYFLGGTFTPYGDPRLSPERSISTDGGIDQYLWHERLRLSGTFFYTHLQQVIAFDDGSIITPATDPYGRLGGYFNTGGGLSHGVELSGEFRPARKTVILAAYTYTDALDKFSEFSTGTGVEPLQVPRIFRNTVTFRASQQLTKRLDVAADFVGGSNFLYPLYGFAYRFDGPRQLGLSANYTIPVSDRYSVRLYTRVWNVLNQTYFEDGFQMPGRWAVGGLRFSF
ncbi:MAG: TonB-dependent receptor [Bryobacteraceae bacterium]